MRCFHACIKGVRADAGHLVAQGGRKRHDMRSVGVRMALRRNAKVEARRECHDVMASMVLQSEAVRPQKPKSDRTT